MHEPVLLRYQQLWVADRSMVKVAEKSRRVGLTWGEAGDSVLRAAAEHGEDIWYCCYDKESTREFILDCADWARAFDAAAEFMFTEGDDCDMADVELFEDDDEDKAVRAYQIRFNSGWRITAFSSKPRNFRGKQGRVILDEAAFHESLEEVLKAALALLIWGGSVCVISTHNGADNPFAELIDAIRSGKRPGSVHRITFDDAIADGLYHRVCLKRGIAWTAEGQKTWAAEVRAIYGDNAAEELDVVPSQAGAAYFSRELVEAASDAALPVIRLVCPLKFELLADDVRSEFVTDWIDSHLALILNSLPNRARSWLGYDFGRSGDLSAIALQVEDGTDRYVPALVELQNVPFAEQLQILKHIIEHLPNFQTGDMDGGAGGAWLVEESVKLWGEDQIIRVSCSTHWYGGAMPDWKAALQSRSLRIPLNEEVIKDHQQIKRIQGIPRPTDARRRGADGEQRHADTVIALALAEASYQRGRRDGKQGESLFAFSSERTSRRRNPYARAS